MTNKDSTEFATTCDAQCKKLQRGECTKLSKDEIYSLLEKTDWDDLDKGEIMTTYILKGTK